MRYESLIKQTHNKTLINITNFFEICIFSGGGRIRTDGPLTGAEVFKTSGINHSPTPPLYEVFIFSKNLLDTQMGLEPMWGDQPRTQHKCATFPGTSCVFIGGSYRVRTCDLLINSQLLTHPSSGAKSIHLIWEDGMRNPLGCLPGRKSAMFRIRRLSESNHSLWSSCLCDRAKVYRETVVFASYWR